MDLLACPICKYDPLDLHIFDEQEEIVEGLISCKKCKRGYPIIEEIPFMLPDELRNGKDDLPFLKKWKNKFPQEFLKEGKPYNKQSIESF